MRKELPCKIDHENHRVFSTLAITLGATCPNRSFSTATAPENCLSESSDCEPKSYCVTIGHHFHSLTIAIFSEPAITLTAARLVTPPGLIGGPAIDAAGRCFAGSVHTCADARQFALVCVRAAEKLSLCIP